jgi:MraZ protein
MIYRDTTGIPPIRHFFHGKVINNCEKNVELWIIVYKSGYLYPGRISGEMFTGDYYCKVDPKGRILFPAKLKKQMPPEAGDIFVGKINLPEKSLFLYPDNFWKRLVEQSLRKINPYKGEHNLVLRELFRGVIEIELDSAGRILLPKRFLDFLSLKPGMGGELVVAGQGKRLELMSKERYEESELPEDKIRELTEKVMGEFLWGDEG